MEDPEVKIVGVAVLDEAAKDSFMVTKLNRRGAINLMTLIAAASLMLLTVAACASQGKGSELKILDLQGDPVLRIDAPGSVFDGIDNKVAVIDDREGTLTFLKDHRKMALRNDPAIQRDNDRYIVKLGGERNVIEVKPDGSILLNGELWLRVVGYTQDDVLKNRFMAAIAIVPLLNPNMDAPDDISLGLPRDVKNAERDPAIRKDSIVWIPSSDETYVDDERIPKADFGSRLAARVDEFLKRRKEPNKTVYIAASFPIEHGTVVRVINAIRASNEHVQQVGLIVKGHSPWDRLLLQIPRELDPNKDLSQLKLDPLLLGVALSADLQVELRTGGLREEGRILRLPEAQGRVPRLPEAKGTLNDTSSLSQALARIFQQRKEQHVYKPGMETRSDVAEDERVEKTVVIRAYRRCSYGDVIKIIDVVKGTRANPIILQLDDLPW
jgi:biopolymer transport protein ExbD